MDDLISPEILREGTYGTEDLLLFLNRYPSAKIVDLYKYQLEELYKNQNISKHENPDLNVNGSWIYIPWRGAILHILSEKEYRTLRLNRNRDLIREDESDRLRMYTVGYVGLSVGAMIAESLVHTGFDQYVKVADLDTISVSNLNRLNAGIFDTNVNKSINITRKLIEINPYLEIDCYKEGINDANLEAFFVSNRKLNLIIEEVDDFKIKIKLRRMARLKHIPLLMLTNVGDKILIDIERYDLIPDLPLFNGLLGNIEDEIMESRLGIEDIKKFSIDFVGRNSLNDRIITSINGIGMTHSGRPQLYGTIAASSGIAAIVARNLALTNTLSSGRYVIDLASWENLK